MGERARESEKRLLQEENEMLGLNCERSMSELHTMEMELMEAEMGLGTDLVSHVPLLESAPETEM